jgi:hypothetical protein
MAEVRPVPAHLPARPAVILVWLCAAPAAAAPPEEESGDYMAVAAETFRVERRCGPAGADEDPGEDEAIIVCGRRADPERYRLPIRENGFDPGGATDSVSRERHRLIEEGDAGIGSCSTVGPGGYTGCFHQTIKRRQQQERE